MSDRKNRDIGQKRVHQNYYWCDCWLCTSGKDKKRLIKERLTKSKKIKEEQAA